MISSPWPFEIWGIDLIHSLPTGRGGVCYSVATIDYITKWVEAKPLPTIISKRVLDFVVKNISYCFRLPKKIVSDNRTQFDSDLFTKFCEKYDIIKSISSLAYLQANGQVEAVNKTTKRITGYFNSKVKGHRFEMDDLVLQRMFLASKDPKDGVFGPKWDGPYQIVEILCEGTFKLAQLSGELYFSV
ncbi:uncharacterized protein LOC133832338 [Humulus lupulus]|uniref:uncharacterized protein LOC133832338 n=1 Tax=Humulus lupulus TaxID=3486 RepID=UPI002B401BF6|nr:uncharacterized protein LOC133832338 [Humulus lupulus]